MLEAVPTTGSEKGKKELPKKPKVRLDPILPNHIVEVWRLYEHYIRDASYRKHPDITEEPADKIQSHLFNYLQTPYFKGFQAKVGKKTAGIILGNIVQRPLGHPKFHLNVECIWVEPAFRRQGIGKALWDEYSARIKAAGIFNFEAWVTEEQAKKLPADRLITVLGGRL